MPSGHQHHRMTMAFLGYDIPWVHRWMDKPATYLGGRHRVVRHNLDTLRIMRAYSDAHYCVAVSHILQDSGILI